MDMIVNGASKRSDGLEGLWCGLSVRLWCGHWSCFWCFRPSSIFPVSWNEKIPAEGKTSYVRKLQYWTYVRAYVIHRVETITFNVWEHTSCCCCTTWLTRNLTPSCVVDNEITVPRCSCIIHRSHSKFTANISVMTKCNTFFVFLLLLPSGISWSSPSRQHSKQANKQQQQATATATDSVKRRQVLQQVLGTAAVILGTNSVPAYAEDTATVFSRQTATYQYQITTPPTFEQSQKPVKTHLDEINFVSSQVKGYQYGITVDPVRIDSLKEVSSTVRTMFGCRHTYVPHHDYLVHSIPFAIIISLGLPNKSLRESSLPKSIEMESLMSLCCRIHSNRRMVPTFWSTCPPENVATNMSWPKSLLITNDCTSWRHKSKKIIIWRKKKRWERLSNRLLYKVWGWSYKVDDEW